MNAMLIVYILLGSIAVFLIIALIVPNDLNFEKSISIDAPIQKVWEHVSTHAAMDKWNPWHRKDPNMEKILSGADGQVGACSHWISHVKGVGEGKQTFIRIEQPHLVVTQLEFIKPFKSLAEGYIKLDEDEDVVIATWGFESKLPYPMNVMKLFMNFKKQMDKDFGQGLHDLKALSET